MAFIGINRSTTPVTEVLVLDGEDVVRALEFGSDFEFHFIKVTPGNATLKKCNIKAGARASGGATEVAEVEAGTEGVVASLAVPV